MSAFRAWRLIVVVVVYARLAWPLVQTIHAEDPPATTDTKAKKPPPRVVLLAGAAEEKKLNHVNFRVSEVVDKSLELQDPITKQPLGIKLVVGDTDGPKELKINCWAFSPDGSLLAIGASYYRVEPLPAGIKESGGPDVNRRGVRNIGEIRVFDTNSGEEVARRDCGRVLGLKFANDRRLTFDADDRAIRNPIIDGP